VQAADSFRLLGATAPSLLLSPFTLVSTTTKPSPGINIEPQVF